MTREIHDLGNPSKSSSVKDKEIYPNEDGNPKPEDIE